MKKQQGVFTNDIIKTLTAKANASHGYSKQFSIFKPLKIKMLRDLENILPEYKGYELGDDPIYVGDICELEMVPNGNIYFKKGQVYASQNVSVNFKEGRDFEFA